MRANPGPKLAVIQAVSAAEPAETVRTDASETALDNAAPTLPWKLPKKTLKID